MGKAAKNYGHSYSIKTKCLSTNEWVKMWYIYTMEYYSAIKRNEIGSFVETWMDQELKCRVK